jgi:hypothetical protein
LRARTCARCRITLLENNSGLSDTLFDLQHDDHFVDDLVEGPAGVGAGQRDDPDWHLGGRRRDDQGIELQGDFEHSALIKTNLLYWRTFQRGHRHDLTRVVSDQVDRAVGTWVFVRDFHLQVKGSKILRRILKEESRRLDRLAGTINLSPEVLDGPLDFGALAVGFANMDL